LEDFEVTLQQFWFSFKISKPICIQEVCYIHQMQVRKKIPKNTGQVLKANSASHCIGRLPGSSV